MSDKAIKLFLCRFIGQYQVELRRIGYSDLAHVLVDHCKDPFVDEAQKAAVTFVPPRAQLKDYFRMRGMRACEAVVSVIYKLVLQTNNNVQRNKQSSILEFATSNTLVQVDKDK